MKIRKLLSASVLMLILIISVSLASSCGGGSKEIVIVAGSTSVQPYAEVLSEEYAKLHPDIQINIQGGGSSAGIASAQSGAADIGMSSRNLKADENALLWSVEIARDGIAIIVNPKNSVQNLTMEQVRGIYTQKIANWSEVGGPDAKINIITREEGSGTRTSFEDLVMNKELISLKALVQNSNGSVRQLVGGDPNSIGFISLGLVDATVKSVQLDGVDATDANILNGAYKLARPFLFVTKGEPAGAAKDFIDYVLSADGQRILVTEGLISVTGTTEENK